MLAIYKTINLQCSCANCWVRRLGRYFCTYASLLPYCFVYTGLRSMCLSSQKTRTDFRSGLLSSRTVLARRRLITCIPSTNAKVGHEPIRCGKLMKRGRNQDQRRSQNRNAQPKTCTCIKLRAAISMFVSTKKLFCSCSAGDDIMRALQVHWQLVSCVPGKSNAWTRILAC